MSRVDALLELPNVFGVLYRDVDVPDLDAGALYWHQGKPAMAYRHWLTDDGDPLHGDAAIAEAVNALPRQPREDPDSYSLVYVDPDALWGGTVDDPTCMNKVAVLVGSLASSVRVVSVEELFYHLRKNFGVPLQTPDDAVLVYSDLPTQLQPGEEREVHVTVLNTGTNVWKQETGYALVASEGSDPFATPRVDLPADLTVGVGYEHTFTFTLAAPATAGTYLTRWRMSRDEVGLFGDELYQAIGVGGVPTWVFEAETGLLHGQGKLEGDGWACDPLLHSANTMLSGPDETRIPGGNHQAVFRLMGKTGSTEAVAELDVYDSDTGTVLAKKTLYGSAFIYDLTYQDVSLPFTSQTGHRLQVRVHWKDKVYLKVDKVTVK